MPTRKFWLSIALALIATLTIPALAAPHVARLLQRHTPPAKLTKPAPTKKPTTTPAKTKSKPAANPAKPTNPTPKPKARQKPKPSASAKKLHP